MQHFRTQCDLSFGKKPLRMFTTPFYRSAWYGMRVALVMIVSAWFVQSCNRENAPARSEATIDSLRIRLEQASRIAAEKDSIAAEVIEATKTINEIYLRLSMIAGKTLTPADLAASPGMARSGMSALIDSLGVKLNDRKQQIKALQARIASMKQSNSAMAAQLAVLENTIAELNTIIDNQETTISNLRGEVDQLRNENVALSQSNQALTVQKGELSRERDELLNEKFTAYVAIGTKDELEAKGIIEKRGKVLFFGGVWQPTSNLREADFRKIDTRTTDKFDVPTQWKIISKHDPALLEVISARNDVTTLRVTNPEKFWAVSKYLIIVED